MKKSLIEIQKKTTVVLILLAVASFIARYLLNILLARHFSAQLYGDFSIAIKVLGIVATMSLLGTNTSSKRFLAKYLHQFKDDDVYGYINWNFRFIFRTFVLCIIVAIASLCVMHLLHFYHIKYLETYHLAVFMLWIAPLMALFILLGSYLTCTRRVMLSYFLLNVAKNVMMLVFFSVSIFFLSVSFTHIVIFRHLFLLLCFLLLLEVYFVKTRSKNVLHIPLIRSANKHHRKEKEWIKTSVTMIASNMVFLLLCAADLVIVEIFHPHEAAVGYYAAVLTITKVMWLIPQAVSKFVQPRVSHLLGSGAGRVELQAIVNRGNVTLLFFTTLVLGLLIVEGRHLLIHFGKDYEHAYVALVIVSFGTYVASFARAWAVLLNLGGHSHVIMKLVMFEFILLCVLASIGTYFWGLVGVAVASCSVMLIKSFILYYRVRKDLNLMPLSFI